MPSSALSKQPLQSVEASMHGKQARAPRDTDAENQHRLLPEPDDAEPRKRRSYLPQPGQPKPTSFQRAPATTSLDGNTQDRAPGRLRPRSMYQVVEPKPGQNRIELETAAARSRNPPKPSSKLTEPQVTGLSQSRSLRKPNASGQVFYSSENALHGRTQSTSSVSVAQKGVDRAKVPAERPKSLLVAPGSSRLRLQGVSSATKSEIPRASHTSSAVNGAADVNGKSEVADSVMAGRPVSRRDEPVGALPRRRGVVKEDATRTAKPAFTTLQQHFTPRKTGKAPTSLFLQPAPAPGAASLSMEVINLQSELLQLHLLHVSSAEISQQWNSSARDSLRTKFEELAKLHRVMLKCEHAGEEQKNLDALLGWTTETPSLGLIQSIQILSGPLHELPSLVEPSGRYYRLLSDFERWMTLVEKIWAARRNSSMSDVGHETIEGLGESWLAENAALMRKTMSFARDMDRLPRQESETSITKIVDACTALLTGSSDELYLMQKVEVEVMSREKAWLEVGLRAIARDAEEQSADVESAVWRI